MADATAMGAPDIVLVIRGVRRRLRSISLLSIRWRLAFDNLLMSAVEIVNAVASSDADRDEHRVFDLDVTAKGPISRFAISNTLRAGIHGLVNTLSKEEAANGITVNALMPGYTLTKGWPTPDR